LERENLKIENINELENTPEGKMKIPPDIQKSMLEFFMRTSIPRKKANRQNHLSQKEKDR
jgi:hypothetical protein